MKGGLSIRLVTCVRASSLCHRMAAVMCSVCTHADATL